MDATLIIIPTFNERENIETLIPAIFAAVPGTVEILVVDDGSPDGTGDAVDALAQRDPRILLLRRPRKAGLASAYLDAFRYARRGHYAAVVCMDADHSHDPRSLPALLAALSQYHLVLGSRYVPGGGVRGWGWFRRALSGYGNAYARRVLGVPIMDLTGGYKCVRADVLEKISVESIRSKGYAFQIEFTYRTWRAGLSVGEVPIMFVDRTRGKSKLSRRIILEAVWRVWALRWRWRSGQERQTGATPS